MEGGNGREGGGRIVGSAVPVDNEHGHGDGQ